MPADHRIKIEAETAMNDAIDIVDAMSRINSTVTVGFHPKSKLEWQVLIRTATELLGYGLVQRHFVPGDEGFFTTDIYVTVEDAHHERYRSITVFDWN